MKVAIIGATGVVGRTMLKVLEARLGDRIHKIWVAASERSVGQPLPWASGEVVVERISTVWKYRPDVALFSAGSKVSNEWGPRFASAGTYVIDNSSRWRMEDNVPLIVPEVNGDVLGPAHRLIANPNCSTIQLVVPLSVLHRLFGLERVYVSTYQAVSGSGWKGLQQLHAERTGQSVVHPAYPVPIHGNCVPLCGELEGEYTTEEWKLIRESRKILGLPALQVIPHAIRVPIEIGHSETVTVETRHPVDIPRLTDALKSVPGIKVNDSLPTPRNTAGQDAIFVGRIRRHPFTPNGVMMWIVADNLRKGAATNAVQILELIYQKGWINASK